MRRALLAATLAAACNRAPAPPAQPLAPPASAATAPSPAAPPGARCDDMSAAQCLEAPRCVLALRGAPEPPAYVCRDAEGPCEGGVAQFDARFPGDCAARAGCRFEAPQCFCPTAQTRVPSPPSPIACGCGGGAPPRCVAR